MPQDTFNRDPDAPVKVVSEPSRPITEMAQALYSYTPLRELLEEAMRLETERGKAWVIEKITNLILTESQFGESSHELTALIRDSQQLAEELHLRMRQSREIIANSLASAST